MTFAYSDPLRSPQGPPPERQRSYKYYAAQASRSNSHSHGVSEGGSNGGAGNGQEGGAAGQEEEDDGGWTVDPPGGKAYTDRLARQRRNKNTVCHGLASFLRKSVPYSALSSSRFGSTCQKVKGQEVLTGRATLESCTVLGPLLTRPATPDPSAATTTWYSSNLSVVSCSLASSARRRVTAD